MKYLHRFTSMADFQAAYNGNDYYEPWVSLTKSNIPLKIKILLPEDQELILNYIEKAIVTIADNTEEMYIWQVENSTSGWISVGYYIATDTIEENEYVDTYIERVYKDSGDQKWYSTDAYSMLELIVIEGPKDRVDYNKQPVDWDFELVWHSADTCGYQELTNFSSRVGFEEVDSSIEHWYHITGQDFTTNPISSFKVKISNCPGYDGVYTVTGDNSGQGTNYWWWSPESEDSFNLQVTVEQNNNVAKLYADFTEGC